jgi:hypothetical protein
MVRRELMVVEVVSLRRMFATHIDDRNGSVRKVLRRRFSAHNRHAVHSGEETTGKEFVLMSATGMSENESE